MIHWGVWYEDSSPYIDCACIYYGDPRRVNQSGRDLDPNLSWCVRRFASVGERLPPNWFFTYTGTENYE